MDNTDTSYRMSPCYIGALHRLSVVVGEHFVKDLECVGLPLSPSMARETMPMVSWCMHTVCMACKSISMDVVTSMREYVMLTR
jgi:hypothetical protein